MESHFLNKQKAVRKQWWPIVVHLKIRIAQNSDYDIGSELGRDRATTRASRKIELEKNGAANRGGPKISNQDIRSAQGTLASHVIGRNRWPHRVRLSLGVDVGAAADDAAMAAASLSAKP
jgi:hypothetical protein